MASVQKVSKSPYWHCFFYLPDGSRTHRSTGERSKTKAHRICIKMEDASRSARAGHFTVKKARQTISDIFEIVNHEKLPSATIKEFLGDWITRKGSAIAPSSLVEYDRAAKEFLGHLGTKADRVMDQLTTADVFAFQAALLRRVSPASSNKALKILRGAWAMALKEGIVSDNVFKKIDFSKDEADKAKRRAFTMDEISRIMSAANPEWQGIILFGIYTGQRLGDIVSAQWRDINLVESEWAFETQKTHRNMKIPMASALTRYLATIEAPDDPAAPVFPEASRTDGSTNSRRFSEILAKVGLIKGEGKHRKIKSGRSARRESRGLSFHCLRHTATSLLKNAGVSDVVAREIIGHESEEISRVYTHLETSTLRKAIDSMPEIESAR